MSTYSKTWFMASLAILIGACGNAGGDPSLNHYADEMSESVEDLQASLSSHGAGVAAQTTLDRIRDLEQKHMNAMETDMDRMLNANDSIGSCAEHMSAEGTRSLRSAQGAMGESAHGASAETEYHFRAMQDAADVDAAQAEEQRHQSAMRKMLDGMHARDQEVMDAMQGMKDAGMSMMCPMSSHMHGS